MWTVSDHYLAVKPATRLQVGVLPLSYLPGEGSLIYWWLQSCSLGSWLSVDSLFVTVRQEIAEISRILWPKVVAHLIIWCHILLGLSTVCFFWFCHRLSRRPWLTYWPETLPKVCSTVGVEHVLVSSLEPQGFFRTKGFSEKSTSWTTRFGPLGLYS